MEGEREEGKNNTHMCMRLFKREREREERMLNLEWKTANDDILIRSNNRDSLQDDSVLTLHDLTHSLFGPSPLIILHKMVLTRAVWPLNMNWREKWQSQLDHIAQYQ